MSQERIYCLAWSRVSGVGPILVDRLIQRFGSLETAWTADEQALLTIDGIGGQSIVKILESRAQIDPQQLFDAHAIDNPQWWARSDAEYPRLLAEIPSAPSILYYRGQVALAENRGEVPAIAIVGTRSPSDYGKKWARKIATLLAQNGFTVVSGLAYGIDAEAHGACLEAGGRTIAIVGTGVDLVYPPQHHELAAAIAQQGLIVSEYVANTSPDRAHFPARNRIIAGLSRVTIVIDAPTKSGALITAYQANDFGRDVYVLPGSIDNPNSLGGLGLLTRGAQPILSLDHLLELLATIPQLDRHHQLDMFAARQPDLGASDTNVEIAPIQSIDVDPELQPIWVLVTDTPISFDELIANSQLPVATVSSILLQLELLGLVTQLPGMRYQR
jgi:DNA processing protein